MSLDVTLRVPGSPLGACSNCGHVDAMEVFTANITHNLGTMAKAVGLYYTLWHPDRSGAPVYAGSLIDGLAAGLADLTTNREYLLKYEAPNGWGTHEALVNFVTNYLAACKEYPDAVVSAWR